jgi:hypothetical protein
MGSPQPAKQPCDDPILLGLWHGAQRRSGDATLDEHRAHVVISLEQANRWIRRPAIVCP